MKNRMTSALVWQPRVSVYKLVLGSLKVMLQTFFFRVFEYIRMQQPNFYILRRTDSISTCTGSIEGSKFVWVLVSAAAVYRFVVLNDPSSKGVPLQ